jgi:peptide/nickel transport system substrate-binding protein
MSPRSALAGFLLLAVVLPAAPAAAGTPKPAQFIETPVLAEQVRDGKLPPVAERLPQNPYVVDLAAANKEPGRHGGTWRMLVGNQRDIRLMTVFGYSRLVRFNLAGDLEPDILDHVDDDEDRIFTLHIRHGHRWSDGHLLTSEDFRYWWDDVANNARLSPGGPPLAMIANGQPPQFEILGPNTVRYTWAAPNPGFLAALAAPQPLSIVMPAHYLKQFHERYADPKALKDRQKAAKVRDWGGLHERMARQYRPENPELPVLDPWRNRTPFPAEFFVFERNPYFHRVDGEGRQLPYIDKVTLSVGTTSLIPAKVGAGDAELQPRYIRFEDYTFLREAEKRNNYSVRLWTRGEGAYAALFPNLNAADETWRGLMRDVRVRRALSLGIDRRDINRVVFFGLAHESGNTVLPGSPLYDPSLASAWTGYNVEQANRLLDEAGLTKRDTDGIRLLPDGRRAELTIETAGENTEDLDVLQLVTDDWSKLGLRIFVHTTQRDLFRRRISSGQTVMSLSTGLDNGAPNPDMDPKELAPTGLNQHQWPMWGQHVETRGREGKVASDEHARELMALHQRWQRSTSRAERIEIWQRMLRINADQVFTIGIVNATLQPIVVTNRLHNVPDKAIYSFEPGAFLGVYMPDTFWFTEAAAEN